MQKWVQERPAKSIPLAKKVKFRPYAPYDHFLISVVKVYKNNSDHCPQTLSEALAKGRRPGRAPLRVPRTIFSWINPWWKNPNREHQMSPILRLLRVDSVSWGSYELIRFPSVGPNQDDLDRREDFALPVESSTDFRLFVYLDLRW